MYRTIERNGLLLTEYPPDVKPERWQFPERNRIISGLSQATLIIEATEHSGTMITADQALEQGKDVFVVPDSIFLPEAKGCLKLLQEEPSQSHNHKICWIGGKNQFRIH